MTRSEANAPIFIIGNPRSGTTLLRLMLTCHPNIVIPPEGGFLVHLFERYGGFAGEPDMIDAYAADVIACRKMDEWNMEAGELGRFLQEREPRNYHDLGDGVYAFFASKHKSGWTRWGDKNNYYLKHIPTLAQIFPEAKFVHIVRDGRDVACSYRELSQTKGTYAPQLPNSVVEIAVQWRDNLNQIANSFKSLNPGQAYTIRYEDILLSAEETLKDLCSFLGEPYNVNMLEYYKENTERSLEPEVYMQWKKKTKEELDPSRAFRWKTGMFLEDVALFEKIAGDVLQQHGYEHTGYRIARDIWQQYTD